MVTRSTPTSSTSKVLCIGVEKTKKKHKTVLSILEDYVKTGHKVKKTKIE